MPNTAPKFVIVTPGRIAYTSPKADKKFTSKPTPVIWNRYLEELLSIHGDIQVITPGVHAIPAIVAKPAVAAAPAKAAPVVHSA